MRPAMGQPDSEEGAARFGIAMRRPVALEIREKRHSVRPRGNARGFRIQPFDALIA